MNRPFGVRALAGPDRLKAGNKQVARYSQAELHSATRRCSRSRLKFKQHRHSFVEPVGQAPPTIRPA